MAEREGKLKVINNEDSGSHTIEVSDGEEMNILFVAESGGKTDISKRIMLGRNSKARVFDVLIGNGDMNVENSALLAGQGSSFEHFCVFAFGGNQNVSVKSEAIHKGSNTMSNMSARGALDGNSGMLYEGLIKINENAVNCNGYQKEDVLLLSENAQSRSIPKLEIDNNDVKCSHGATTSHLDNEKVFYLMSRGLKRKDAEKLVVFGFLSPMLEKIGDEALRNGIKEKLMVKLE